MSAATPRRQLVLAAVILLSGCASVPVRAVAQRGAIPDFVELAERVLPAVVNIAVTSEQAAPQLPPELRGTPLERYFRDRLRNRRQEVTGAGSGFIIDPAGFIVTNNHVVGNATRVVVALQDGSEQTARVVGTDELTDLALLKIEPRETRWRCPSAPRGGPGRLLGARGGNPFGLGGGPSPPASSGPRARRSAPDLSTTSSRPTRPSTRATPAARCSTADGEVIGINTAIIRPGRQAASASRRPPTSPAR